MSQGFGSRIQRQSIEALRAKAVRRKEELLDAVKNSPVRLGPSVKYDSDEILKGNDIHEYPPEEEDLTLEGIKSVKVDAWREGFSDIDHHKKSRVSAVVNKSNLRTAVLASEILAPPLSLREIR